MFPLFETIRLDGGKLLHLDYHNTRLNRSRFELSGLETEIDLANEITIPPGAASGVYRCRVEYTERIKNVTITPYTRGTVKTLKLVTANHIEYAHKFVDRSEIHHLLAGIRADDILMLKNGQITDTSIANIAFFDGKQWITPSSPLLPGTTRARLLDEGRLTAEEISQENLHRFSKAVLVNAMLGFDPDSYIEMKNIAP